MRSDRSSFILRLELDSIVYNLKWYQF